MPGTDLLGERRRRLSGNAGVHLLCRTVSGSLHVARFASAEMAS